MTAKTIIGVVLIILAIILPIACYLTINVPANVQYGNRFGAYVTLATQGQPDFQGIQQDVNILYTNMNQSFPDTASWSTTYNSPWPWDRTFDNSLLAESQYLHHLNTRIVFYEQLVNKSGQNQLSDVYNQAIKNLRSEMNSSGGLDWAINGAWYLRYAPVAYWDGLYILIADIIMVAAAILLFASDAQ